MKTLFIQPSLMDNNGSLFKSKNFFTQGLALPLLAALTPKDVEVEIVNEIVEDVDFDSNADLIGITASTAYAARAYQIASEFRKRGKKVVVGGIHATALPDEAVRYCDSVVIGEAENVWNDLINDFRKGSPKKFYKSDCFHNLKNLPVPRYNLLNKYRSSLTYLTPIQASRGCPHNCDFCSVTKFFGKTYRFRPVSEVVRDIRASGAREFFFVDDNIAADKRYSRELFKALIPLNIKWGGSSTVNLGRDPELCRVAAKSGCIFLCFGIESINQNNLYDVHKGWNKVKDFELLLKTIRKSGIGVGLAMIIGLNDDDEKVFQEVLKFSLEQKAFGLVLNFPIPYPGTELAKRLENEKRILHKDWSKYRRGELLFVHKRLPPESLKYGYSYILKNFYSLPSILKRAAFQPRKSLYRYFLRNLTQYMDVKKFLKQTF